MTETPKKPDFFIVGAPKCGTTSMCHYLDQHPNLFISDPKEPRFFDRDLAGDRHTTDPAEYLRLFQDAGERLAGEGSVTYIHSQVAPGSIRDFNPAAKIIIMLRDPVEMLYSLHSQLLYSLNEDIRDFGQAVAAEDDRREGRRIPATCDRPWHLLYTANARLAGPVARYIEVFGQERVHLILYDDLCSDVASTYRQVLAFLEVARDFTPDFRQLNSGRRIRSQTINRLQRDINAFRPLRRLVPGPWREPLNQLIARLNSPPRRRPPMPRQLRQHLRRILRDDVQELETLIGRDLSHWYR